MVRFWSGLPRVAPRLKWQVLAFAVLAGFLLASSVLLSITFFGAKHVLSTPRKQSFSVVFAPETDTGHLVSSLSISPNSIRYASSLQARLQLALPESDVNLEHSVFTITTELRSFSDRNDGRKGNSVILASQKAQAVLNFRSACHRSIRAFILAIPLLTGLVDEYQRIRIPILFHKVTTNAPVADTIRIRLHAPVQVASADLYLIASRRAFMPTLIRELAVPFMLVTIVLWYSMIFGIVFTWAVLTQIRKILSSFWDSPEPSTCSSVTSSSYSTFRNDSTVICRTHGIERVTTDTSLESVVSAELPPLFGGRKSPVAAKRLSSDRSVVESQSTGLRHRSSRTNMEARSFSSSSTKRSSS